MAMSDTTSTTPDWSQLYHRNIPAGDHSIFGSSVADSTVVTTTTTTHTISPPPIEGRVGKSTRRRSRASRKAPTTLLNTDTTNFRAMVQQFTGIPSGPYSSTIQPANTSPFINFGVLSSNDSIHFNAQQQQQQPPPPQYTTNNPSMFMLNNSSSSNNNNNNNNNNSDGFFLDGPRPASSNGYLF